MSLFDQGWGQDLSDSFESLNHAPVDNTMRYGDNHGEATTKGVIAAGILYGLGGGFGLGDTSGGGTLSGPSSPFGWLGGGSGGDGGGSGGALGTWGGNAIGQLRNLIPGMGGQQQPQFINPFSPPQEKDQPWKPMQFQNQSFAPYLQNVANQTQWPHNIFGRYF